MGWLKNLIEENKSLSRMGQVPAHQHFMLFGNKNDEGCGLPEIWKVNGEDNLKWLDVNKDRIIGTVRDLPEMADKALIFVGMSPILKRTWKYLKDLDDRFVIIACNSSAKFLGDRGIIPHYVVAIDGRKGNWSLDIGKKFKDCVGIFSVCLEPEALRTWPGKIMIVPYGVKDKSLKKKIERRYGVGMASGGNSINSAVAIFALCTEAKIMLFAGMELSYKKNYYADRHSSNDDSGHIYSTDVFGNRVKTLIPLFEYKVWLENLCQQMWPEYHFCNCSEGILGVDIDGSLLTCISQKRLDFAVQDTIEAWDQEAANDDSQYKMIYDKFYSEEFGNTLRGKGIWNYCMDFMEWEKGLDVGCGRANGVEFAREKGREVWGCDISDTVQKCWEERNVAQYCRSCEAKDMPYDDDEFDMIICSEVMEHIPEHDTDGTLKEILRVGSDKFFFTIALTPEQLPIAGYIQTHINLQSPEWWCRKFEEMGYKIVVAATNQEQTDMSIYALKDETDYKTKAKTFSKTGLDEFPVMILGDPGKRSPIHADYVF